MPKPVVRSFGTAILAVACLLASTVSLGRAHAQASKRVAALDLIPVGISDFEARKTTEILRRAVGRNPRYRLAPAPLRLRPMLLALGCAKLDAACLVKIGKQLEVELILFGEIARHAGQDKISLQLFDVKAGRALRAESREAKDPPGSETYVALLEDVTQLTLGESLALTIESNVQGAIILVNGQPVGTTPFAVTEGLVSGTNEVVVRRPGFQDFVSRVVVRPGRPLTIQATLLKVGAPPSLVTAPGKPGETKPGEGKAVVGKPGEAKPGETKPGEVKDEPFYKKWWFWTVVGVVVVGGATAGIAAAASGGQKAPTLGVEF